MYKTVLNKRPWKCIALKWVREDVNKLRELWECKNKLKERWRWVYNNAEYSNTVFSFNVREPTSVYWQLQQPSLRLRQIQMTDTTCELNVNKPKHVYLIMYIWNTVIKSCVKLEFLTHKSIQQLSKNECNGRLAWWWLLVSRMMSFHDLASRQTMTWMKQLWCDNIH